MSVRNLVLIVSDSVRRDHLGCYGSATVRTPSLDALARDSRVFDRAYSCSFPTLPCRAELFTGKFVFPYLNWGPLPQREVLLSETLARAGFTCTLVTDNLPLSRPDYLYFRGFHSVLRIRGQLYDNFQPLEGPLDWPCAPEKISHGPDNRIRQYLRNVHGRRDEEEYFAPQVVRTAIRWLEQHHHRSRFFLYVDLFDPHEPWDPPAHYVDLYDPVRSGDDVIRPVMGPADAYSEGDLRRIRALYAGEVTMADRWIGELLAALDALGHREDTTVAYLSDHGLFLGERGLLGKLGRSERNVRGWPTYSELSRVPCMIRSPGVAPGRSSAYVHPGDLTPTLLELAGVPIPDSMHAASLAPLLRGERERVRDLAVSSWSLRGFSAHRPSVARTDEWALVFWRSGLPPELYHLPSDPGETRDVFRQNRSAARELHRSYVRFLRENGAPLQHLLGRCFLAPWSPAPRPA
ncbi:MAG: sulfatase [Armatimonadetes bacterium]|nr:sulfatase [Armatimonadota bacterium]